MCCCCLFCGAGVLFSCAYGCVLYFNVCACVVFVFLGADFLGKCLDCPISETDSACSMPVIEHANVAVLCLL